MAEERERERERERDDSGEIRNGCKRSDYWRLLERAREGRTEEPEVTRDLEILESLLGEGISGQGVLRGERDLRGFRAGTLEHADQPTTGLVLGIPQVPVQYGHSIYVQQRCGDTPNGWTLDSSTWGADYISSIDEVWGIPVGKEGPPESGYVFLRVCCWAEDAASGVSPDIKQAFE